MTNRLLSLLGLARKANLCSFGHDAAKAALRQGRGKLCILCANASPRLKAEFRFLAGETKAPIYETELTSLDVKQATQYKAAVFTVNESGFAAKIIDFLRPAA
jgi:ribosomal protein L30E